MKKILQNKKELFVILNLIICYIASAMKISDIKGTERLSNYSEIKNINIERVVDYDNYERKGEFAYVNGESKPITGLVVSKKNNRIMSLIPYVNGNGNGVKYEYYENGQLSFTVFLKNNKQNGTGSTYNKDGKLRCNFKAENGIRVFSECYNEDKSVDQVYNSINGTSGILTKYYKGTKIKSFVAEVTQNYSNKGTIEFINNGRTLVYNKKGTLLADLNYKNDSIIGLQQKFYVNGKLKYDLIAASEDPKNFKAMNYAIEYYDNSDIIKLDCREKERGKGKWTCKEYNKNGSFKREFDSPTYKFKQSGTKDWINYLLPVLKLLTGW